MKLFIANTSTQKNHFHWRLPENPRLQDRLIQPGAQIGIDVSDRSAAEAIVEQHRAFGISDMNHVESNPDFAGLVYSFDKPLDLDAMKTAAQRKDQMLHERGTEMRKAAAVASADSLKAGAQQLGGDAKDLEVEIVEQQTGPGDGSEKIKQTIAVGEDGHKSRAQRRR